MSSLIEQITNNKVWDFFGGVHPPENKKQSSECEIIHADLADEYVIPLKQHIGRPGDICVCVGDSVLRGQALTAASLAFMVPVHAPTSGTITAIEKRTIAHPSGLSDLCVVIKPDFDDTWIEKQTTLDYVTVEPEKLIERIRQSGIAGLGGAGFPTARKLQSGLAKTKILIINAAECEPYITADDRLMRDYATEVIQGIQILQHIVKPEATIIAIEDNKPEATAALEEAARYVNLIIRVIPTKYPSGASRQLIKVITGREVPHDAHSSSVGILMQNVGTAFAIKRAIFDGEPLIERVVTLTGEAMRQKGNAFVRLGTPMSSLLTQFGYKAQKQPQLIMGGSLMGFTLPHANVPVTKVTNCIIAPKRSELAPINQEMPCIRCGACAEVCPAVLLPQQLQWYAKDQDYDKCEQYNLSDCIECGACAYVCPSQIPLVEYYRQAKSEIWTRNQESKEAERAKIRFEARKERLETEKMEREQKFKEAAERRRNAAKATAGSDSDAIQAAIARVKAQKEAQSNSPSASSPNASSPSTETAKSGNTSLENVNSASVIKSETKVNPAVAAAIARAKAKKAAANGDNTDQAMPLDSNKPEAETETTTETAKPIKQPNPAVAAAIARAKAKKAAANGDNAEQATPLDSNKPETATETETVKPIKQPNPAVAAAIARAKAKKAAVSGKDVKPIAQPETKTSEPSTSEASTEAKTEKVASKKVNPALANADGPLPDNSEMIQLREERKLLARKRKETQQLTDQLAQQFTHDMRERSASEIDYLDIPSFIKTEMDSDPENQSEKKIVSFKTTSSPHVRVKRTTSDIMLWVTACLIPGIALQAHFFGYGVLVQLIFAVTFAWAFEAIVMRLRKRPVLRSLKDNSAMVTAILLAVSIPPYSPWWITFIGIFFAIVVSKHIYGGIGQNLFNPAMVAYVVLLISFPVQMTSWVAPQELSQVHISLMDTVHLIVTNHTSDGLSLQQLRTGIDGTTMATPLDTFKTSLKAGQTIDQIMKQPPFAIFGGIGWQWINIAYMIGGVVLLKLRVIQWHIPVAILVSLFVISGFFTIFVPGTTASPWLHLFSGATMLGAFFIATDPITASTTVKGRIVYGLFIGLILYVIRSWGGFPDGVAFAVILANMLVPLIDYYTKPRTYGHSR